MTDWIVDPDPTTLLIGMECEVQLCQDGDWYGRHEFCGFLRGNKDDTLPWLVDNMDGELWTWAAHIRVNKPVEGEQGACANCGGLPDIFGKCLSGCDDPVPTQGNPADMATALVPMTQEDVLRLREIAQSSIISEKDYPQCWDDRDCLNELADRIEAHMPKPKPQRPEIAVDEAVWVRDRQDFSWEFGYFAGWDFGEPAIWRYGGTSHTTGQKTHRRYIKTQDGTVWKGGEN